MLIVARTPPEVSLYHRHGNPLFPDVLDRLGRDETVHASSSCRAPTSSARAIRALRLPSLVVPDRAVDAQSLIAAAAAVVSAGGTMNREAVALGTPVYTTFSGPARRGRRAADPRGAADAARASQRTLDLDALPARGERLRRDPNLLLDLLLGERG